MFVKTFELLQLPGFGGIETHSPLSLPWGTVLCQVLHQLSDVPGKLINYQ